MVCYIRIVATRSETTQERILQAARDLFFEQGTSKTSVGEVARRAGLSRVTVYRHFTDREVLVRSAFSLLADGLEGIVVGLDEAPPPDLEASLRRIGDVVTSLPLGIAAAMGDLETAHPAVYQEVRRREHAAIRRLFDHLYSAAEGEGRIRPGLDRRVVEVLFWEVLTGFLESPALREEGITPTAVYTTVISILLQGILAED